MNKDLMGAGFLLIAAGLYVGYLFTVKRGLPVIPSVAKAPTPKAAIPVLGTPPFNPAGAVLVPRGGSDPFTSNPANLPPKWGRYTP
jgi:hypothetical protein